MAEKVDASIDWLLGVMSVMEMPELPEPPKLGLQPSRQGAQ